MGNKINHEIESHERWIETTSELNHKAVLRLLSRAMLQAKKFTYFESARCRMQTNSVVKSHILFERQRSRKILSFDEA